MMNVQQAGLIDPILTSIAVGFEPQEDLIANVLFPQVEVDSRSGELIVFGKEAFRPADGRRVPGETMRRVQIAYSGDKYSLQQYGLEGLVPVEHSEEAMAKLTLNLAETTLAVVIDQMTLDKEVNAASIARNASSYASTNKVLLSGSNMFSDPTSDPFTIISEARQAVRRKSGRKPNVAVFPSTVLEALSKHPKILDRISTSVDRNDASIEQLQNLFKIQNIYEAGAIRDTNDKFFDVWGNDIILAYVRPKNMANRGSRSFGYNYALNSGLMAEEPYYDRSRRSIILPVVHEHELYMTCPDAGYLIQNAVPAQT